MRLHHKVSLPLTVYTHNSKASSFALARSSSHSKRGKSLPSSYIIGGAVVNFNVKRSKSMRTIQRPLYTTTSLVIPKLKPVRRNVKVRPAETAAKEQTAPVEWVQKRTPHVEAAKKPPSPIPVEEQELLPSSEELWKSYEARKQGAKPEWPICCIQTFTSKSDELIPTEQPARSPASTVADNEKPQDDAVTWLLENHDHIAELSKRVDHETDMSTNIMDMDSLEISLDEERGLLDCLKSMRLHTPLSDIKAFDMLQGLVRSGENRKMLHDLLKAKLLGHRASKDEPKCLFREPIAEERQSNRFVKEKIVNRDLKISAAKVKEEPLTKRSVIPPESEVIQQTMRIVAPKDEVQPQAMEKNFDKNEQPMIISIETLPACNAVPQDEEAVQRWLQELSQHLSSVVQSRIQAMPTQSTKPNSKTKSQAEPIDFEAEISQLPPPATGSLIAVGSEIADPFPPALNNSSPWEGSYKERLEKYDNVIDENMSEFRDPLEKRLRGRLTNSNNNCISSTSCNTYVINNSIENLKRVLLMPALPSHLDQGLQQIRILRPPTKRKIEQAKLTIEMKTVRTYGTIHVNFKLDLNRLALEMDNAVYNSDIQVLQKRYEAAQIAWIWENGSVLISNVRNKTILSDTQDSLMTKILEYTTTPTLNERSMQQSQMITIAQFPWHICIEEFCQTYSLSSETIQGSFRYGYYVNKSIPSVAAKVYESGAIHVMAMSPADADQMVQKLYLITANHRKARSSRILLQAKPKHNGTFISLFPNKTDKAKSS